jgi:hypothetical protein
VFVNNIYLKALCGDGQNCMLNIWQNTSFGQGDGNYRFWQELNVVTYIANGVTTIFELDGRVEHFGQGKVAKGKVIGPRRWH